MRYTNTLTHSLTRLIFGRKRRIVCAKEINVSVNRRRDVLATRLKDVIDFLYLERRTGHPQAPPICYLTLFLKLC